jgi:hypothetical protein
MKINLTLIFQPNDENSTIYYDPDISLIFNEGGSSTNKKMLIIGVSISIGCVILISIIIFILYNVSKFNKSKKSKNISTLHSFSDLSEDLNKIPFKNL